MFRKLLTTSDDGTLALLRLVLGVVFFAHGAQKMLGWFGGYGFSGTMGYFTHSGIPAPLAFLAIAAGFLSRIAAFGIVVNMLVAVLTVHLPFGLFMNWSGAQKGEGFEFHLLAIAIGVAILVKGAGALSMDRALSRTRPE
jgi:putative oxidoreductase